MTARHRATTLRGAPLRLIAITAVAAVGVGVAWSTAGTTATVHAAANRVSNGLPAPGTVLPRFSPIYMGKQWHMTAAQAVAAAQEFDVIAAQANIFKGFTVAMHAANPNLRIVAYMNGMFDQSTGGTGYPASWYATTAGGSRIRSSFGNWLMDPSNNGWDQAIAQKCAATIASSGYDGCFLDTLGTAPLGKGYDSGIPINPATGAVWNADAWLVVTSRVAAAAQAANPNAVIIANGLSNGPKYYANSGATSALLAPSGVAMAEIWSRIASASVTAYPTLAKWTQDVDMLVQSEAQGHSVLAVTKLWTSASAAQQAAWHKFALGSFLLGADGHSYFSFLADRTNAAFTQDTAWDHVNIGTPTGAYALSGGVYQRSFTNGIVAVNPNSTGATINLGGSYTNLNGTVVTSETLAPHTADVFVNG